MRQRSAWTDIVPRPSPKKETENRSKDLTGKIKKGINALNAYTKNERVIVTPDEVILLNGH